MKDKTPKLVKLLTVSITMVCLVTVIIGAVIATDGKQLTYNPNLGETATATKQSVNKYCTDVNKGNRELIRANIDDIKTTITFAKPLSEVEFLEFLNNYSIEVSILHARGLQPDGIRTGLSTIYDKTIIGEVKSDIERHGDTFIGFVSVNAYVDSKNLAMLQKDPIVYLTDTSADDYFVGEEARSVTHHLTWVLEDLQVGDYAYSKFID